VYRENMKGATFDDYSNEKEVNFKTILDCTHLHGWKMCGPGRFDLVENAIVSNGGMGLLWYTDKQFRDFILKVQWKTRVKGDNSGVFVRFADPDDDPGIAVNTGYEIQIYDEEPQDEKPTHRTGAIYNFAQPSTCASNEPGKWNIFEIHAVGHNYTVILNNTKLTAFTGNRQLEGYIGLQNHDPSSRVSFGKIVIKEL
jgi:hypothetical protein